MRRITYWALSTITTVVLLFGYHTSTAGPLATSAESSVQTPISGASTTTSSTTSGSSGSASSGSGSTSSTVTGGVAQTQWGPVQVELTVAAGAITDVSVVQYPNDNGRDAEINGYALPILIQETLDAQSADIDMVSGATVTSVGYVDSLQSALDQAGL